MKSILSEEIKLTKPVCEEQDVNELVNAYGGDKCDGNRCGIEW